jgi:hypothetical protein
MTDPPARPRRVPLIARAGVDEALALAADRTLDIESRAGAYALLHQVQLRIRRVLGIGQRSADTLQAELIAHMERNGLRELGPLSVASSSIDAAYPCNDPDNWSDDGVQDAMSRLYTDPQTAPFVRYVPKHYEIDTAALGEAVATGHGVAVSLLLELKARGWRTEEGRRLSLRVREAKP